MDHENRLISVSTRANVNIALLKYWGKRDEELKIPYQTSIALTLDNLYTDTTIMLDSSLSTDELFLNGSRAEHSDEVTFQKYMYLVRKLYPIKGFVRVESSNHVPTAAGLASSASAYASIALALNEVFNLKLDQKGLSVLARLGSGSAARSIYGGFSMWHHGDHHAESFATSIESDWDDLVFVVVLLSDKKKQVSSREAMKKSVELASYNHFVSTSRAMVEPMLEAIKTKNIHALGALMEKSSDLLHQTIRETGIDFYLPQTYKLLEELKTIKCDFPLFYTIDAGPNVKLLTTRDNVERVVGRLSAYKTLVCGIGKEAYVRS